MRANSFYANPRLSALVVVFIIALGAMAFLAREYKVLAGFVVVVAGLLAAANMSGKHNTIILDDFLKFFQAITNNLPDKQFTSFDKQWGYYPGA